MFRFFANIGIKIYPRKKSRLKKADLGTGSLLFLTLRDQLVEEIPDGGVFAEGIDGEKGDAVGISVKEGEGLGDVAAGRERAVDDVVRADETAGASEVELHRLKIQCPLKTCRFDPGFGCR